MTYQYTTPSLIEAEIRASVALSATTVPSLTQVTTWIEEESEEINHISGSVFGQTARSELIDYDGEDIITLKYSPVISVTRVLYSPYILESSSYALSDTKVEDTDFSVYENPGEIAILFNSWIPKEGRKRIQIDYVAGYADTPKIVQKLATKKVAKRVMDSLIQYNMSEGNVGGSVTVGAISIVEPANLSIATYKQLDDDIGRLENKLVSGFGVYRYTQRY